MPKKPIRLVVSDLDGTLLDSTGRLSPGALESVHAAQQADVAVSLASGRGFFLSMPVVQQLGIRHPVILSGGALILSPDGMLLDEQHLSVDTVEALVTYARQHGMAVSFHEPAGVYAEANDAMWKLLTSRIWFPDSPEVIHPFKRVRDLLSERPGTPVRMDLFGDEAAMAQSRLDLPAQFPDLFVLPVFRHLEITRAGVNKGSAVRRLGDLLGVALEQTLVIGDEINDASMFAVAGTSVAMGNALAAIKTMADAVAPTNNDGGFAWALKEFVL